MADSTMRVFFLGDELVAGVGDSRGAGWVGRVMAQTITAPPLVPLTLAVPGETTAQLGMRWYDEVSRRIDQDQQHRLVLGVGSHDLDEGISSARSRLYVATILENAIKLGMPTLVVGPPPRRDLPARSQEMFTNALADVCARRAVPFVDTFHPLQAHEQWNTDITMSGGYTPGQAGYSLIAWLVLHSGWHQWLGLARSSQA